MTARSPANALRPLARARRLSTREQFRRALIDALARTGVTQAVVAEACGRTPQKVALWCNPAADEVPSALDVLTMPVAVRAELRKWEAMRDTWTTAPAEGDGLDHGTRLGVLTVELSDVLRSYAVALPNGLNAAERAELLRELQEAYEAIGSAMVELSEEVA